MKLVVIYPGRFQPFGPHHAKVYTFLCSMFGPDNVYIATSNKTQLPDSPLNFYDKLPFIQQYVPADKIKSVVNPYKAEEITKDFDLSDTVVIFAYSAKDAGRIAYVKSNNELGYLQPYDHSNLQPANKHGYVFIVPNYHVKYKGKDLSGTYLRLLIRNLNKSEESTIVKQREFAKIFGNSNKNLYFHAINKIT